MYMQTQTPIKDMQKLLINSCRRRRRRRSSSRRLLVFIVRSFVRLVSFFFQLFVWEHCSRTYSYISYNMRREKILFWHSCIGPTHRLAAWMSVVTWIASTRPSSNICRTCSGWNTVSNVQKFCHLLNACIVAEWVSESGCRFRSLRAQSECWP